MPTSIYSQFVDDAAGGWPGGGGRLNAVCYDCERCDGVDGVGHRPRLPQVVKSEQGDSPKYIADWNRVTLQSWIDASSHKLRGTRGDAAV